MRSTRLSSFSSFAASRVVSEPSFNPFSIRVCWFTSRCVVDAAVVCAKAPALASAMAAAIRVRFMMVVAPCRSSGRMHDRIRYVDNEPDRTGVDGTHTARDVKKCSGARDGLSRDRHATP
jgi:hypothetical protein